MTTTVTREQVLAYRAAAQGLHRDTAEVSDLAVLDLGVQDTPPGSAAVAVAARLAPGAGHLDARALAGTDGLATTWSVRGAPHVHRADDLAALSRALWPWSDEDALARLDTSASPVRASGMPAVEAVRFVAEQMADIVGEPMPKGEVSTALTPRIPAAMTVDCRVCKAVHIVETLFRSAVLPAGIAFEPAAKTVTFVPIADWPGIPEATAGAEDLIRAYLRLHGPATPAEVAAFLGTKPSYLDEVWPEELVEVMVDDRPAWIPADTEDLLTNTPEPPAVRLLPPSDPWLQARDRAFVVPDDARREVLWPILGRPGAVLADGEIVAAWRARKRGRRLEITLEPFRRLPKRLVAGIEEEAVHVAAARGTREAILVTG